jgi:hypothetical protein
MKLLALWALFVGAQALLDEPTHNARSKPTFIVNLDTAIVVCQHSANNKDLHMHDLSILVSAENLFFVWTFLDKRVVYRFKRQ